MLSPYFARFFLFFTFSQTEADNLETLASAPAPIRFALVAEAPGAQRRVLEFCYDVSRVLGDFDSGALGTSGLRATSKP